MLDIPKAIKEELPETSDGLREYIQMAEYKVGCLSERIKAAYMLLREKEKGKKA